MEISSGTKVGMISLLAIIILGLIFSQIGNWKNRDSGYELYISFDRIAGLQPQARVSLSGVTVGKVKEITILPSHKIRVVVLITYKDLLISKNSVFTVVGSLWGDKWIEIYTPLKEGKDRQVADQVLKPGDEVQGIPPVSMEQMAVEGHKALQQFREVIAQVNKLIGDPKTQAEFKGTIANFYEVSKNVKSASGALNENLAVMVKNLRLGVDKITSDLMVFSGSAKNMAVNNEEDIRLIVKNLKVMSHNLTLATETIKNITTKKEFSEDVAATLSNIKKAAEEIAGIASDIRIITSDPQIHEDLRSTIHEAKETVHQANVMFKGVNQVIGGDKEKKDKLLKVDAEVEWNKATGLAVPNLNVMLFPEGNVNVKVGADSIGHSTLYNLQGGTRINNFYPRFGIVRSNLGIGLDSDIGKMFRISIDAYDTQNTKVDAIGKMNIGKDFYLLGGQRNIFNVNAKYTIFGVGKNF